MLLVEAWFQLLVESVLKILASNKATTFPNEKLPARTRGTLKGRDQLPQLSAGGDR